MRQAQEQEETHSLLASAITLSLSPQFKVPIEMEPAQWVVMIEQLVLFVLILGRWMLPKGDISRDELSQLLLVYIGMAADIIECECSVPVLRQILWSGLSPVWCHIVVTPS